MDVRDAGARGWEAVLTLAVVLGSTGADRGVAGLESSDAPRLRAVAATSPITVDGRIDEPAWEDAPASTGFVQREPEPFVPATEDTEVRVVYSDEILYVGVEARDSNPGEIVARELGRDVPLFREDSVAAGRGEGLSGSRVPTNRRPFTVRSQFHPGGSGRARRGREEDPGRGQGPAPGRGGHARLAHLA